MTSVIQGRIPVFIRQLRLNWRPVGEINNSLAGLQISRWRKPIWLPPNKSKVFYVPKRRPIDREEYVELKRLYQHYRTIMHSIRYHFANEMELKSDTSQFAFQQKCEEEAEHQLLMEYNRLENERIAKIREEQKKKLLEERLQKILHVKEQKDIQLQKLRLDACELISETQESAKNFIDRDQLESAIEMALLNPVDFSFAIDRDGRVYPGHKTKPRDVDKEQLQQLESSQLSVVVTVA